MDDHAQASGPCLKDGFTGLERLSMQLAFYAFIFVGIAGIWQVSIAWAGAYGAVALIGLLGPVLYGLCSHCPYPYQRDQCLFLSPAFVRRLYKYRGPQMSRADGTLFIGSMAVLALMPLIWLVKQPVWLAAFLVPVLYFAAMTPIYYCRRCRHVGCPLNLVRGKRRREAWSDISQSRT